MLHVDYVNVNQHLTVTQGQVLLLRAGRPQLHPTILIADLKLVNTLQRKMESTRDDICLVPQYPEHEIKPCHC